MDSQAIVDLLSARIDDAVAANAATEKRMADQLKAADARREQHSRALATLIRGEFATANSNTRAGFHYVTRRLQAGEARFARVEARVEELEGERLEARYRRDERRRWLGWAHRLGAAISEHYGAVMLGGLAATLAACVGLTQNAAHADTSKAVAPIAARAHIPGPLGVDGLRG